jgi:hypothetical protein
MVSLSPVVLLKIEGNCSCWRAKVAHMVGHLPRVDEEMPLASLHAFMGVVPADVGRLLDGFHRLGIHDGGAGMRIFANPPTFSLPQPPPEVGPEARAAKLSEVIVNGLITNDKLCLSRTQRLRLRQRSSPTADHPPWSRYAPQQKLQRGGPHASTPMAPTPSRSAASRRAATVGSRLPTSAAMERAVHSPFTPTHQSGGHPCK